ncbi:hypothetical protein [Clostridium butanoliproducens]|uniref:hypothetical protein n=1 Tax=Clostridium butanoliproducens TaxID=2991837 RepID=UPI0024B95515|nr:hypothetical protein [Clostridium butanoliproducens]
MILYQYYGDNEHNLNIAQYRRCAPHPTAPQGTVQKAVADLIFVDVFISLKTYDFVTDPRGGNKIHPWGTIAKSVRIPLGCSIVWS